MNIKELEQTQMNNALAYTLGLIFPLYKELTLDNENSFILGCVNHNAGKVTQEEILKHYIAVCRLFNMYYGDKGPQIKANKTEEYTISPKLGFSVLVEKNGVSKNECIDILTKKVEVICNSSEVIKKEFIKGCFDGRASFDTTYNYLSIDVDRDYKRQDLIINIIEKIGLEINNNRRKDNYEKNDQIRIKPKSLNKFMSIVGLYSVCRERIIKNRIVQNRGENK